MRNPALPMTHRHASPFRKGHPLAEMTTGESEAYRTGSRAGWDAAMDAVEALLRGAMTIADTRRDLRSMRALADKLAPPAPRP